MKGESLWTIAWPVFGLLAVEVALLVGIAVLIARRVPTAAWRRTTWQACIVALLGLLVLELSGSARYFAAFVSRSGHAQAPSASAAQARNATPFVPLQETVKPSAPPVLARNQAEPAEASPGIEPPAKDSLIPSPVPVGLSQDGTASRAVRPLATPARFTSAEPIAWLVLMWLCGASVLIAFNTLARLSFAWLRHRSRRITDPGLHERVKALAHRMGLRRSIDLFESPRLLGPVATGAVRPAIGLPPQFTTEHTTQQQEVMLAHEVAHLAANDPFWSRLADILAALLWWHPLAWWARRQLRAASEIAADESSLLVREGPRLLAECLVALGGRLTRRQPAGAGGLGVEGAGFRSGLGRRVERLLRLPVAEWAPPDRVCSALARTLAPAALVAAIILCTAWTVPQPSTHGDRMKNAVWNRSLPLYALLAALYTSDSPAIAADAPKSDPSPLHPRNPMLAATASPAGAEAVTKLKAKLDSIVLDEVAYDSLPLGQIVEFLGKEAAARDPEKVGVNFLFGQPTEPINNAAPAIDPATGLPAASTPFVPDLTATTIRIVPPLKKVRLTDLLEAIKRVADQPITYTVESYAVVISLDAARINAGFGTGLTPPTPPAPVVQAQTRFFRLDTNTFFASVKNMFRRQIDPASESVGADLQKGVFNKFGVKWNAPDSVVLYNPLTGVLLVRASQEDLLIINAAIEMLGGAAQPAGGDGGRGRGGAGGGVGVRGQFPSPSPAQKQ